MNTAMPMLLLRIQRPLSFAKQHVRFAHLASNSSKDTASSPSASSAATPSASSSSSAELALPPQVEEEVFLSRYRDPFAHDKPRSKPSYYRSRPSTTPAPTPMRSSAAIREEHRQRDRAIDQQGGKDSPRAKRLEMERLWSGGEASPMIPLSHYTSAKSKRKHALVFPGSGSQYVGQGKFVEDYTAAQSCWEEATDALNGFEAWRRSLRLEDVEGEVGELGKLLEAGYEARRLESSLQQIVFEGPQDELTRSVNAQPAILITSISLLRTLESEFAPNIVRDAEFFLGHSSGEYTALVASGAASFTDGVRLTRLHGLLTTHALALPSIGLSDSPSALPAVRSQMSALILNPGHSHAEVAEVVASIEKEGLSTTGVAGSVEVASFNSRVQIVLSGTRDGILRASDVLRDRGIAMRVADLPVSAPFHCSFMRPAGLAMSHALSHPSITLSMPTAPILSNNDGSPLSTPSSLISSLVSQVDSPVHWTTCLSSARTGGVERMYFFGPGKSMANLARKDLISRDNATAEELEIMSVATIEDMLNIQELCEAEDAATSRARDVKAAFA